MKKLRFLYLNKNYKYNITTSSIVSHFKGKNLQFLVSTTFHQKTDFG